MMDGWWSDIKSIQDYDMMTFETFECLILEWRRIFSVVHQVGPGTRALMIYLSL